MKGLFQRLQARLDTLESVARGVARLVRSTSRIQEALGRIESRQTVSAPVSDLAAHEFRVFSQWGEDGIIDHLLRQVPVARKLFVEFGVEDYSEANTRFLLTHRNWAGLIMDASPRNIAAIRSDEIYWRHNLKAEETFITRENINGLLSRNGVAGEIGLLSIDIDGNDYWVWEAIEGVQPALVVVEYNARFGGERAVTVPYKADFERHKAHHSGIYYGASLKAFCVLAARKGYALVGSNTAGNNAFFVRRDLLPVSLKEVSDAEAWVACQFRETRDAAGKLCFATPEEEAAILAALPLVEVT